MGIGRQKQRILTIANGSNAVAKNGDQYTLHPGANGFTLMWRFDVAGSLAVQFLGTDKTYYTFDTQAVVGAVADVQHYFGNVGDVRVVFTPSAGSANGFVDATYSGYAGSSG